MFEFESFEEATVAAALLTGPRHRLVQCNRAFRALFGFWRCGQEAGVALAGSGLRPVLRALDRAGTDRSPALLDAAGVTAQGPPGHRFWVVSCLPVTSRHGASVLLLAVRAPDELGGTAVRPADTADPNADLARYEALHSAVPQVVWRMTPQGEVSALVGSLGETGGGLWHPSQPALSWMDAVHPKDRDWFAGQWAATARGDALLDAVVRIRRAGNPVRYRHVKIIAVPVLRRGELYEWIGTVADAEDQWRQQTRDRLLKRASATASARDLREAFATTASAVVPDLVDAFVVFQLRHPEHTRSGAEALNATRARTALAAGVPPLPPITDDFTLGALAETVVDSRRTKLVTFPPGEPPKALVSEPSADWMVQARATSLAIVPVVVDERTVALAAAATCLGNPPPDDSELRLLEEVLHSVRGPLRRALELQSVRHTALVLQRSFLTTPPHVDGAELAAVYQPASATAEIGGDWYDAIVLPDGAVALSIGDIAGHDLDAATQMTKASSMLRALAYADGPADPAHTLSRLDHVLQGVSTAPLITALHTELRPTANRAWSVTLSNAGHPPPLLIPADGPPRYLHGPLTPDPPLCVAPDMERHHSHHELTDGDTLLLYTDGLVEVAGTDISDGLQRLADQANLARNPDIPLTELVNALLPLPHERADDVAILAFRADSRRQPPHGAGSHLLVEGPAPGRPAGRGRRAASRQAPLPHPLPQPPTDGPRRALRRVRHRRRG
ncbi:SpoIIE family protein phosphatase [Streptomyces sp. NBC_01508]|uniref:SpoIIE family protein phosphatase n=1 Tax=Streptomyces sp. NBC_01508 TaxID=2903888 RepID=UPI00386D3F74